MAKIIDDETMENVCILAKLSLSEEEKEKAKAEMQKMLDYVEKLDELDTSEVEPMSHIFQDENVFREDVVTNGDNKEAMLANAPKAKAEMQKMLDYVEKLDELDTSEVEPMSHIFQDENVFREDVVTNGDNKEAMLANAPKAKEGQYQVPKTIG